MGARLDRTGTVLRDFQTAQLGANDKGWTTRGHPEGRAGGANTYKSPHIRQRHYRADAFVTIALRLDPPGEDPGLAAIAAALATPVRPLFIGRKPCLPSRPILSESPVEADTVFAALRFAPLASADRQQKIRFALPPTEWPRDRPYDSRTVADVRDWRAGVHAGESWLDHFSLPPDMPFDTLPIEALP